MPRQLSKHPHLIVAIILAACMNTGFTSCKKHEQPEETVVARGNRNLGIHVVPAENQDFLQALSTAKTAGMNLLPLIFQWSVIDGAAGYDPDNLVPAIDLVLPANNLTLSLTISPIAADHRDLPPDIATLAFDDPIVINRYKRLIDSLAADIHLTQLSYFLLGNEVDLYFSNHTDEWAAYTRFCEAIAPAARVAFGAQCKIGAECTAGSTKTDQLPYVQTLNANLDIAVFTYYPLSDAFLMEAVNVVAPDIDALLEHMAGKKLMLEETGYATGAGCLGSDQLQADFIKEIFKRWDRHPGQLEAICFLWLTDLSQELAQQTAVDYGVVGTPIEPAFVDCIRTLGLYTRQGAAKPGFAILRSEAAKRGWTP